MKISVLKGSPNINGSSNMLADNFAKGAEQAGHSIKEFDIDHKNISPCTGCLHCGYEGECILNDDIQIIFQTGAKKFEETIELLERNYPDYKNDKNIIIKPFFDNMTEILKSDMLVFVTPLYYYGISAQLKTCIDRFCSRNFSIQQKNLKSALLTVAYNADDWTFEALESHYDTLVRYLNLNDCGRIMGYGCGTPSMTQYSEYPAKAYQLGKEL